MTGRHHNVGHVQFVVDTVRSLVHQAQVERVMKSAAELDSRRGRTRLHDGVNVVVAPLPPPNQLMDFAVGVNVVHMQAPTLTQDRQATVGRSHIGTDN